MPFKFWFCQFPRNTEKKSNCDSSDLNKVPPYVVHKQLSNNEVSIPMVITVPVDSWECNVANTIANKNNTDFKSPKESCNEELPIPA